MEKEIKSIFFRDKRLEFERIGEGRPSKIEALKNKLCGWQGMNGREAEGRGIQSGLAMRIRKSPDTISHNSGRIWQYMEGLCWRKRMKGR